MSKERISWENEYPDELERESRMRPTLARAVRDHEAAGNAVDEAVAEAVWADGEGEAAAMDVVDDAAAMGAVAEAAVAEAVGEGGRVKSGRPRETQQQKLARIKRELDTLPGVTSVSVSQSDRCVAVDFDPTGVNQEQIGQKLTSLGFEIAEVRDRFR